MIANIPCHVSHRIVVLSKLDEYGLWRCLSGNNVSYVNHMEGDFLKHNFPFLHRPTKTLSLCRLCPPPGLRITVRADPATDGPGCVPAERHYVRCCLWVLGCREEERALWRREHCHGMLLHSLII